MSGDAAWRTSLPLSAWLTHSVSGGRAYNTGMEAKPKYSQPFFTPATVVFLAISITLGAQPSYQPGVTFPMIGISTAETVRLNAVNVGTSSTTQNSSCSVTLEFLDVRGQVISQKAVTLRPPDSAYVDLSRSQLKGDVPRVQLRAVLLFGYSGGAPPTPDILQQFDCNILPSLEMYDEKSGRTRFILTDAKPLPGPTTPVP